MEVEIITIDKSLLKCEFDQNVYCFRQLVFTKGLKYLFYCFGYFVYHRQFDFDVKVVLEIIQTVVEKHLLKHKCNLSVCNRL